MLYKILYEYLYISIHTGLGENLVSASKSGSEVTVRAQDDRMEHFWLNGISLRDLTTELETSAGWPARFSIALLFENQAGQYNQDKSMAGRYGRGVYIRNISVPSPHSATTLEGVHTFRHIEKKHSNETRGKTDCWEDLQAKTVRGSSSPRL